MGRWCQVECNCPSRVRVDPRNILSAYQCGHRDGEIFGFSHHHAWPIVRALKRTFGEDSAEFQMFFKIGNFDWYVDESTCFTTAERIRWQEEIELLSRYVSGRDLFPTGAKEKWDQYWFVDHKKLNEEAERCFKKMGI